MPSPEEEKRMIESFRTLFIHVVNPEKDSWDELSRAEKKELDQICKKHFSLLQF